MKRTVKTFISLLVIALLTFTSLNIITAQESPSPLSSPNVNQVVKGTVELDGETLFVIEAEQGSLSPTKRAERINKRLQEFAENDALLPNELQIYTADAEGIPLTTITVDNLMIIALSNRDAQAAGRTRTQLAEEYLEIIKTAVNKYRTERGSKHIISGVIFTLIATLLLILAFLIIHNIFARIYQKIKAWGQTYIRPVRIGNFELIRANQLDNVITFTTRIIEITIIVTLLILYFPFVLSQFPWTKRLAVVFEGYLLSTLQKVGQAFINYLPSLLTIICIIAITIFLVRLSHPIFKELGEGTFSLPGFYPEWADPTYKLVTFLIIALAAVIIFPLLPGFQSPAFQGISVFLGLLISLGSTSVISNLVSGSIIIYTRAFRVGDRIKIGEISGKVLETTLLVTRILTPTNIIVSIPNSQISTSSIENLSFSYRELNEALILRITVYLGYEVPWREAYQALIQAALCTNGVAKSPEPFVLQGELNEVYVTYLLNIYIDVQYFQDKTLKEIEQAKSQLHENIRDCCAEARIRIFAPSYEADPTNYGPAAIIE